MDALWHTPRIISGLVCTYLYVLIDYSNLLEIGSGICVGVRILEPELELKKVNGPNPVTIMPCVKVNERI